MCGSKTMRITILCLLLIGHSWAKPQLSFGGQVNEDEEEPTTTSTTALPEIVTRAGPLIADVIGECRTINRFRKMSSINLEVVIEPRIDFSLIYNIFCDFSMRPKRKVFLVSFHCCGL